MRILCIVNDPPWPARNGFGIRLSHIMRSLGELGTVDVVVRPPRAPSTSDCIAPSTAWLGRVEHIDRLRRSHWRRRVRWYFSRLPRSLLQEQPSASQFTGGAWQDREYDLVWFGHLEPYLAVGDAFAHTAHVIDFDNLDDWALRHRLAVTRWDHETNQRPVVDRLRSWRRDAFDRIDALRMAAVHRRVARQVEAVTVCSELDGDRLSVPSCFVVPNAYEVDPPERAAPELTPRRSAGPVVTMVALFRYAPNADGAACLVDGVLPHLRADWPDAQVRLVGRPDGALDPYIDRPGVVIRGEVADIGEELGNADVVAVPIRYGGGTRIKVLEAFARRIPVVTTTVGIEGLDVHDGEHVLVADDAASFAAACGRVFESPTLAKQLTDAAYDYWAKCHRADNVRDAVGIVVDAAIEGRRSIG